MKLTFGNDWCATVTADRLPITPDTVPPSPVTRRLLSACLDLISDPLLEEVQNREPDALARLRQVDQTLHAQREDRHRADALLALIGNLVEDYADRPTKQKP